MPEPSSGRVISGLEEMWAIRWSAAIRILPLLVPEDRVGGAVAGPVQHLQGAVAERHHLAVASGRVTSTCEPQPRKLRETLRSAQATSSGMPLRSISSTANSSSRLGVLAEVGQPLGGDADRRHLGAGVLGDDLDQAEVVDVLVGDDDQLDVVDRVAALAELGLQLVERLARVGAGVDQGQRLVLDQVAVDPPDRERGRDAQAVDAGQRRPAPAPARGSGVTPGSARGPRRACASMSSRETSDSRLRRSSGSVLEGRTLKCQSA